MFQDFGYFLVKHTRPTSAKVPKVINGKPYYPSVEEVMALLQADRANVIERFTSGDSEEHPDQHLDVTEPTDIAAVQREQERLRSEVVGRTEPKIAFIDEAKDITSGVLPATIRRNSPSGSLSSIDSLDAVPDEELETMPASTGSPIAGIIRKGNKAKRDSRVTFNERVAFSDGVVGTLKRKQGNDLGSELSTMPKQKSYFEFPDNNTTFNDNKGTDSKLKINGTGLESSKDSLILNHYVDKQSKNHMSSSQNYPHVNTSAMATTGVMTYSKANNNNLQPGGKMMTITTPELKVNELHVLPSSPSDSNTSQMAMSQSSSSAKNTSGEKSPAWKMDKSLHSGDNGSYASQVKNNSIPESSGIQSKSTFVNGNTSDQTHNHDEIEKSDEKLSLPFSSINASMLRDSLEMHNDIRVSQNDPQVSTGTEATRVETRRSDLEKQSSGYITKHADIPPETPLVPVTRRDFLSKALHSENNGVSGVDMKSLSDARNHSYKNELSTASRVESNNNKYFGGKSAPSVEQQGSTSGYSMYSQHREDQKESKMVTENGTDRTGQSWYGNDSHNQSQISSSAIRDSTPSAFDSNRNKQSGHGDSYSQMHTIDNRGIKDNTESSSTTVVNPYYNSMSHPNTHLNQGRQFASRDTSGMPRPSRTHGESFSAIPLKSRPDHSEKAITTQNTLQTTIPANQPSYRRALNNGKQNFASKKPGSADELLKSVQENIERLSMTPSQQGIPRTSSSGVQVTGPYNVGPYNITTSENRHNRTYSDSGPRSKASDMISTSPSSESKSSNKSAAIRERKLTNRKATSNEQKSKVREARKVSGNNARFHRSASDSGIANQRNGINMETRTTPKSNHEITPDTNTQKHMSTYTGSRRVQSAHPNHKMEYTSLTYQNNDRLYGVLPETRDLHTQTNFERKQRQTSEGLAFLDKTPTDEEINHLWETVRTCLKHEQPQKAASDSVVNNVRYSRSESGPLVGNHYLIDGNAWASKPRSGSDNETQYSRDAASSHLHRQGSLDSLQRRGHDVVGFMPPRKGSLLQHRSSTSERRLTSRNSQAGRPPLNPQFLHSLRGPKTSSRGPVKSNTLQPDGRPQLSYAEFQAVMQASADIKTRNTEGDSQKNSRQNVHQPIIMNYRRKGKENHKCTLYV